MLRIIWVVILLHSSLFSLEIDNKSIFNELLPHAEIYKDNGKSETISTIKNKNFVPNNKELLAYGYSPNFNVWIRFTLTNSTEHKIEKIIEYNNPLSSYVDFFEKDKLKKQDGLLHREKERKSLSPILKISLNPHESKEFYIKTSSKISTLIIKLNLWNIKTFQDKDTINKIILALFFGAISITILYNLSILFITQEASYFYYVFFFISVGFHHLMYTGVSALYFSSKTMELLISLSSVIVALPTIFLALFTKNILKLEQYPRLNKILTFLLIIYPIFIVTVQGTQLHQYRNLFFVIILLYLFITTLYALIKGNKTAPFLFASWILFVTAGMFMHLSSLGKYNILQKYPYYTEFSLILVILIFSWLLASKIKTLNQEKINAQKDKFLLKELKHRIKNNMQIILSMLLLQKNEIKEDLGKEALTSLETRIMATTELYSLLDIKDNLTVIDMYKYFSLIEENINKTFRKNIFVSIQTNIVMNAEYAIYLGLIVNEALTNTFKHSDCDHVEILLEQKREQYQLLIKDNGNGFSKTSKSSLGLKIIDTLARLQLDGTLNIKSKHGLQITIKWKENEK